jgi:cytochrome c-type biogenesis protein CcmH/NrfG
MLAKSIPAESGQIQVAKLTEKRQQDVLEEPPPEVGAPVPDARLLFRLVVMSVVMAAGTVGLYLYPASRSCRSQAP